MKILQHRIPALLLLAGMGLASTAKAALVERLGGQAVYDTDLNITWLADANANHGMTWDQANAWAAGLNVGGVTGWRLPTALNADGSVRQIVVLRHPTSGDEATALAIAAVKRAAPYGNVARLPRPWRVIETFLFDDDMRFKPRTLDTD